MSFARLNDIIKVGSNVMAGSYEGVLDGLRRLLEGVGIIQTEISDVKDNNPIRAQYHEALAALQASPAFKALAGKVSIWPVGSNLANQAKARVDFESIVALQTLTPFVIHAAGADGQAALDALWQSAKWSQTYQDWLADKASIQAGEVPANFTNQYLDDRAAMLASLVQRNKQDTDKAIGTTNTDYVDTAGNVTVAQRINGMGLNAPANKIAFGSDQDDPLTGTDNVLGDHLYGGAGIDTLNGLGGADWIEGGTGDDILDGGDGDDRLFGGDGADTYNFNGTFGKDTVIDSDGRGSLSLDGQTLTGGTLFGGIAQQWKGQDASGVEEIYTVTSDPRSATGKKLVITKVGESANSITINNFDLTQAQGSGYLGIKLDNTPQVAVTETGIAPAAGQSGANFWSNIKASLTDLAGQASNLIEGAGKTFTIYLNQAAKAGETITLGLSDLADKFKAVLGDSKVDADGAVITLAEGQTQVSIALVQEGNVTADASGSLSVTYQGTGDNSQSATSNSWGLNLSDAGAITTAFDHVIATSTGNYIRNVPQAHAKWAQSAIEKIAKDVLQKAREVHLLQRQCSTHAGGRMRLTTNDQRGRKVA